MQKNKGFTLIELLVVIAIIGILASIVLTSLSSARQKGADAKIQSQLSSMRAQAEMYYGANGDSYGTSATAGSCAEGMFSDTANNGLGNLMVTGATCNAIGTAWSVSAPLSTSGEYFCVDSIGTAESGTKQSNATTGLCQ